MTTAVFAALKSGQTDNMTTAMASVANGNGTLLPGGGNVPIDCTTPLNFLFVLYTVVMGAVCTCGLVGNAVSFVVLQRDNASPVASFLLQSLAVTDNTLLASWMLHYSVRELARVGGLAAYSQHPAWLYIRIYNFTVVYMAQTATVWLTVVLAVNRLIAVCSPYSSPRLCKLAYVRREVAAVAAFAILFNAPRLFEVRIDRNNETSAYSWTYTGLRDNPVYAFVYSNILYSIITFALPLLILGAVNTRIIIAYRATRQRKRSMQSTTSSASRRATENNVTLVMIIVIVIFMLCLAPARFVQIVTAYTYDTCRDISFYLIHLSNSLEMLNSSVNFVIYVVYHKRFRQLFCDLCCCTPLFSSSSTSCCGRVSPSSDSDGIVLSTAINKSEGIAVHSVVALTSVYIDGKSAANGKVEMTVKITPKQNGHGYRVTDGASSCSSITKHADDDSSKFIASITSAPSASDVHDTLLSPTTARNNDNSDFGGVYLGPEKAAIEPPGYTTD